MKPIAVYGATGHTGRFVVDELRRRGLSAVAVGRSGAALHDGTPLRTAAVDDAAALARAFHGCAAVINCAGPFLDTALPVAEAAGRAGASYIDVTAEQASAIQTFEHMDSAARSAGVLVIPAAGFFGGLADLLATALAGPSGEAEALTVAIALDHWWPTAGTRKTGERNRAPRLIVDACLLQPMALPATVSWWPFEAPFGEQAMVELPFSEVVTIVRHLKVRSLHSHLNQAALADIRDAATPPPTATDSRGRSAQCFSMVVQCGVGEAVRAATASGRDIYAVSAPLVAEAAARIAQGDVKQTGALSLAQAFDPNSFLNALSADIRLGFS